MLVASTAAHAQRPFLRPSPLQRALDADGDGAISAAETSRASAALNTLDADKNGAISSDEMRPRGRGQEESAPPSADDLVSRLLAFDANSDGRLEKSEVPERMQGLFARGDRDNDGALTTGELKAMASSAQPDPAREGVPVEPLRRALDTDQDGSLSQAEIANAPAALAKLDRNADGVLSGEEIRPAMRRGPGRNPAEMYKHILEENDANHDGKLAVSELPDRMREFLGRADTNGDGFISQEEMGAMRPRRNER
jgi:Ca2+-binding EF-hand superfamily protein